MRIVRYVDPCIGGPGVGIVDGDSIAEVPSSGGDLGALLLLDRAGLERVASTALATHKLSEVRLLPPVGNPGKILPLAGNYHPPDKDLDINLEIETPEFFSKPNTSLLAHDEVIPMHEVTVNLAEEIELGVVIGKPGRRIARKDALDHVFGYTVMNDVSARELRFSPDRSDKARKGWFDWLNGKWLDGYCPVGPWIVHQSDIRDPHKLEITTKINGKVVMQSNSSRMIWDIPSQIEYISRFCTMEPGDLIVSGVVGHHTQYLQDGDVVEGTIDDVGTLRNPVGRRT